MDGKMIRLATTCFANLGLELLGMFSVSGVLDIKMARSAEVVTVTSLYMG